MKIRMSTISAMLAVLAGCGGGPTTPSSPVNGGQPAVTVNTPSPGASQLSGHAYNVNPSTTKVVVYVLTNQWYVQPLVAAPFTDIASDGSWQSSTNPWQAIVVLLVNPSTYTPAATKITNPALDPGVLAYTSYPSAPISVTFSGRTWGIKMTGNVVSDQFEPGPNYWSSDPSVVNVAADGLHLKITKINGNWQSGEVYLLQSLGYGTYTVQINSRLDQLDTNTVAAPLFIYADTSHELDNEYSGSGGLIPTPNNAQFVAQPYTVPGNLVRYGQPAVSQFTSQMDWQADHVTFRTWNGWSAAPAVSDIIYQWTYTGSYIPQPGQESVHINLWLLNGQPPVTGTGDEMVIQSFAFQGTSQLSSAVLDTFPNDDLQVSYTNLAGLRSLSADALGRQSFDPLLQALGDSMRSLGIEAAKDIDEVMLGWRDDTMDLTKVLGLVAGRFKPDDVRRRFERTGLPVIPYKGSDIYQLGSAGTAGPLYFTLFRDSLLAFGQFNDVTAMIDTRAGRTPSIRADSEFMKSYGELDGAAAQWGVLSAKAARKLMESWLPPGSQEALAAAYLVRSVQQVLYRVQGEDRGGATRIVLICNSSEDAAGIAAFSGMFQQGAKWLAPFGGAGLLPTTGNLRISPNGSRVEVELPGPSTILGAALLRY